MVIKIEELIEKAKNKDKDAYCKLILSIENYLYKIAKSRLSNIEDIQDVVQSTILNAYIHISSLENSKSFKPWITQILINECNLMHKTKKKNIDLTQKYFNSFSSKDYVYEMSDFDNIIKNLNATEKRIFALFYEDGFSIKQISTILDININTTKSILHRGKRKIMKSYKPYTLLIFIICILKSITKICR